MIESLFTGMAGNFMQKAVDNNKPFFIYMPYFLVHAPFEARQDYIDHFQEKLKGVNLVGKTKKQKKGKHSHSLATVLAMTKMLDDEVGRLLGKLDELGVRDNTVVLFTSDNGSYDRNLVGGYRGRKGDTYDGGMRVPYIFRWPGKIAAGSKSNERIIGVDIYPTLLSLAGIPLPKPSMYPVDGVDISPILLGKAKKLQSRNVFCCYPKYARFRKGRWAMSWRNVVYNGSDKLIEYPEYDEYELFSLDDDPKETKDLSKSSPEKRAELTKILHRWLIDVGAPPLTPNPDYKATPPKK
jgi:arylsulfatase A-like enzyme